MVEGATGSPARLEQWRAMGGVPLALVKKSLPVLNTESEVERPQEGQVVLGQVLARHYGDESALGFVMHQIPSIGPDSAVEVDLK